MREASRVEMTPELIAFHRHMVPQGAVCILPSAPVDGRSRGTTSVLAATAVRVKIRNDIRGGQKKLQPAMSSGTKHVGDPIVYYVRKQ